LGWGGRDNEYEFQISKGGKRGDQFKVFLSVWEREFGGKVASKVHPFGKSDVQGIVLAKKN